MYTLFFAVFEYKLNVKYEICNFVVRCITLNKPGMCENNNNYLQMKV